MIKKITPRRIVLGLVGLIAITGLYFVINQVQKITHPAYPVVQGLIYQFEKNTGNKITFDSISVKDGAIIVKNVYTDIYGVSNDTGKDKKILFADSVAINRDLSAKINNLSVSSTAPDGTLIIGLRDVRISQLQINNNKINSARIELASLFLSGSAAPQQMEKIKTIMRGSGSQQATDFGMLFLNKLPQTGVAFDIKRIGAGDKWLYNDRWFMVDMFDINNVMIVNGAEKYFNAWLESLRPQSEKQLNITDFIKFDSYKIQFKDLGIVKQIVRYIASRSNISPEHANSELQKLQQSINKSNPKFTKQTDALFSAVNNLISGKKQTVLATFDVDQSSPQNGKVLKITQ